MAPFFEAPEREVSARLDAAVSALARSDDETDARTSIA